MEFSKLFYGFVKIDTWISLSCYRDLSKVLHGFIKVVTWIFCFMFFLPFGKQNQTDVWPRFQSLLKLLLWNKVVEWVKVFNAMGLLFYHYYLIFFPATPASFPQRVLKCARCASEIYFHVWIQKKKLVSNISLAEYPSVKWSIEMTYVGKWSSSLVFKPPAACQTLHVIY